MTDAPTLHDLAVMSNDMAATALGLQQVAVWAIIFFGSVQFLLAVVSLVWALFRDRSSTRRHDETMSALNGRRDDAERQHKETMERLRGNVDKEKQSLNPEDAREIMREGFRRSEIAITYPPEKEPGH